MAELGRRDADIEELAQDIMLDDYYSSEEQIAQGRAAINDLVRLCREARDQRDRALTVAEKFAGLRPLASSPAAPPAERDRETTGGQRSAASPDRAGSPHSPARSSYRPTDAQLEAFRRNGPLECSAMDFDRLMGELIESRRLPPAETEPAFTLTREEAETAAFWLLDMSRYPHVGKAAPAIAALRLRLRAWLSAAPASSAEEGE